MRICVIGLGNDWASDDGVGPEVVRRLRTRAQKPGQALPIEFIILPQADPSLLDVFDRCDIAILVDAVVSGASPGTVYCEEWQPGALASRGIERTSSHGLGVRELLDLAAALDRLPRRVLLWGIEVVSTEPGRELSDPVAAQVPALVERLYDQLRELLNHA